MLIRDKEENVFGHIFGGWYKWTKVIIDDESVYRQVPASKFEKAVCDYFAYRFLVVNYTEDSIKQAASEFSWLQL